MKQVSTVRPQVPSPAIDQDPRWAAVVARDGTADGAFYYSVRTTGVYCRPSCGARRPRPAHVQFHATAKAAEDRGFRPCKRCRPHEPHVWHREVECVADICRMLERATSVPTLATLAARARLSPYHFHRVFKRVTGLTPRAYAAAHRARRARTALSRSRTVTEAIYAAGFESSGRFYAEAADRLGMTPAEFRAKGENVSMQVAVGMSSLGSVLVAQSHKGICAILIGDDPEGLRCELNTRFQRAQIVEASPGFRSTLAQVIALVEDPGRPHEMPLDIRGTAFQQRVWQALRQIPAGTTATYAEIAARIGQPGAVRAVGRACGANPVAVAVPCHRVLRTGGGLSGYRWGTERKRMLLERERRR